MPKIARIAYIVAFVMAGLILLAALTQQIILLPFAFIPLMAGIGIMRKRVWSARGFSHYLFIQLLFLPLLLFVWRGVPANLPGEMGSFVLIAALAVLFKFAERALAAAGSTRGWALPWIALYLLTFPLLFVKAFVIPRGDMENTLLIGDRILVQRLWRTKPVRGDMIVFAYPMSQTVVTRIIGVAGDRIRISDKIVYRNGYALQEPYVVHKAPYPDSYRDKFPSEPNIALEDDGQEMLKKHVMNGEVVVPEGKYFVLGDNRDNSLDSRYWGFVDSFSVIGKPLLIYDSEEPHRKRWERFFKLL